MSARSNIRLAAFLGLLLIPRRALRRPLAYMLLGVVLAFVLIFLGVAARSEPDARYGQDLVLGAVMVKIYDEQCDRLPSKKVNSAREIISASNPEVVKAVTDSLSVQLKRNRVGACMLWSIILGPDPQP